MPVVFRLLLYSCVPLGFEFEFEVFIPIFAAKVLFAVVVVLSGIALCPFCIVVLFDFDKFACPLLPPIIGSFAWFGVRTAEEGRRTTSGGCFSTAVGLTTLERQYSTKAPSSNSPSSSSLLY